MTTTALPDSTRIGAAHLVVRDRAVSLRFYRDYLGFHVLHRDSERITLGARVDGPPLICLSHNPVAVLKPPRSTGLYHVAIRLPARGALGRLLRNLAGRGYPLQGAADHLVSEAVYLVDPDGNGLELYHDRPRNVWQWDGDQVAMATDPLDMQGVLHAATDVPWTGIDPRTDIGHVHLHVSDLAEAEAFWVDALGFTVMQRSYPGALFVAAGGYHHHLGLNTWAGYGAPPPPPNTVGLRAFSLILPDKTSRDQAAARLEDAGYVVRNTPDGLLARDVDDNAVILTV
jgi:catechol 2,3-dioxygenase